VADANKPLKGGNYGRSKVCVRRRGVCVSVEGTRGIVARSWLGQ
jgi:hypothetical protein